MGLFKDFKNFQAHTSIKDNGLPDGTNSVCCETCCYRMYDTSSSYLVCAQHKAHVGASQVCNLFSRGEPMYKLS
jgi:hypothetical protein